LITSLTLSANVRDTSDLIEDLDRCAETTYRRPAVASPATEQQPKVLPFRRTGE